MSSPSMVPLLAAVDPVGPSDAQAAYLGITAVGVMAILSLLIYKLWTAWLHRHHPQAVASPAPPPAPAAARAALPSVTPASILGACPVCGAELPADASEGLCPQCLMQCAVKRPGSEEAPPDDQVTTPPPLPNLPAVPSPAELAPHFPDLEILELLGQGGMGAVYKARQRKLDRMVAIKVLPPEWGRDPAFAERFGREARALARMNHANIVSVHDFGEAGGNYYLIMEYVDGANLRQFLTTSRLQPWQALPIIMQVCDALQYAHEQGVVHRDIKPENILLDKRGRVKIADFGLVKLLTRSRAEFTLTVSGQVMGTFDYMAPEQRMTPQTVDHRADIYSLGVVFYEMLTGELPVGRFGPPSERTPVDARLDEVVFRALERDPDRRYQRISAVKMEVEAVLRATEGTPGFAAASSPEKPADGRRGRVRGFFLSAFSMFRPGPARLRPAAVQAPYVSQKKERKRSRQWAAVLVVAAGMSVVLTVLVNVARSPIALRLASADSEGQPQGLTFELHDDWTRTASLTRSQAEDVKKILLAADQEYLEMERSHTRSSNPSMTPAGTNVELTINPFPDEIKQLEDRVWAKLEAIVPNRIQWGDNSHDNFMKQLPQKGSLFTFGKTETKLTISRDLWNWYHWTVIRELEPPPANSGLIHTGPPGTQKEEGNGQTLPRRYKRFWHGS